MTLDTWIIITWVFFTFYFPTLIIKESKRVTCQIISMIIWLVASEGFFFACLFEGLKRLTGE